MESEKEYPTFNCFINGVNIKYSYNIESNWAYVQLVNYAYSVQVGVCCVCVKGLAYLLTFINIS